MSVLWYVLINVVETLLRMVPWPCKTGLIEMGHPDRHSPVLLTCSYHLTVARVRRALQGVDGYLLVANSRGVNVWCSAAGGLLTHHDVISALKTSGIEGRVEHRTVILPQLAATGIEAHEVRQRAGWEVLWGPVEAHDLPAFLASEGHKTPQMRAVSFGWGRRLEMAVAWAFPVSLLVALALLIVWGAALLPAVLLTWALALVVFLAFPLYARRLGPRPPGARGLPFEQGGLQIAWWGLCLLGLVLYGAFAGTLVWAWLWRWGLLSLILVVLVTVDLTGMTPVYKSGTHEDRWFRVALDVKRCIGDGSCEQVCPRNCFVLDAEQGKATISQATRCVQCGACIVQCPGDALAFVGPTGEVLAPEVIRRYKLNMMGKRVQHSR
jgi:NAD-dependent dihydropyrimidine dehydrogenase PreA subunit